MRKCPKLREAKAAAAAATAPVAGQNRAAEQEALESQAVAHIASQLLATNTAAVAAAAAAGGMTPLLPLQLPLPPPTAMPHMPALTAPSHMRNEALGCLVAQ